MTGLRRLVMLCTGVVAFASGAALAQFPSELVSFEGTPAGDPADQEMFQEPQVSGSTSAYVVPNVVGFDRNGAFRSVDASLATDGTQALEVYWDWVDENEVDAWVRLGTFNGALRPNPSLHTQGKVRMTIANFGDFNGGDLGVCLGIRETGNDVPQMDDGGTVGDIEWVGVDTTINAIIAGSNGVAETTASGDDVQVIAVSSNGLDAQAVLILPGVNGTIDSTPAGDDIARFGYYIGTNGLRVPLPAVTLPISPFAYALEWDLVTGNVTVDDGFGPVVTPAGIAPFTGNGILDPANNRGTLEHIAFTNVTTDPATGANVDVKFGLDAIQFEAPVPDPVLPPTVVAPIIAGDPTVTVTDLMLTVDQVNLLKNGSVILTQSVVNNNDFTFTLPAAAVTDDVYTATQRDGITGQTSAESLGVTVLAEPSPYSFALLLDEGGSGSCTLDWEWVGTGVLAGSWAPGGQPIFANDAVWQTVDIPLNDPALVKAGLGGDGTLDPSPTGFYNMDSIWFTIAAGADSNGLGPWEVFIDRIETIGTSGIPISLMSMEDGVNRFGPDRGQASTLTTSSALSSLASYDGTASHRLLWTYGTTAPTEAVGKLQRVGGCGTAEQIPDSTQTLRFHILARNKATNPAVPLPAVVGPIIEGTQDTVRVTVDANANTVQLYINGTATGGPVVPTGLDVDFAGLTLAPGDSISATQDVGTAGVSDFAYPRAVSSEPFPPVVQEPLLPGAIEVTLTNVLVVPFATATEVTVYEDGSPIGTVSTTGFTSSTVVVPVTALSALSTITATQTVNTVTSDFSAPVMVGVPAPVIYLAPAAGATSVRVTALNPSATEASVTVNGSTVFTTPVTPGAATVDVPVSGLVMGDVLVANQKVGAAPSADSDPEVVTTATVTATVWCDDFEYADQTAFNANWPPLGANLSLQLSTIRNTTPAGAKSMFSPDDASTYRNTAGVLAGEKGTDTHPAIFSINIYDETAGTGVNQYADINDLTSDFFLAEIGMTNFGSDAETHYTARLIGNGGPSWFALDQFDGPVRSVGWHNYTMVFKGSPEGATTGHEVDVYVDGLLAAKNVVLLSDTLLREPRIGSGQSTSAPAYFDDYCVQVGPVTFPDLPPNPPTVRSPIEDGDTIISVDLGAKNVLSTTVYADGSPIGTLSDPAGTNGIVQVTTSAVVHLQAITADVTNSLDTSPQSAALEVGKGNGDLLISLGIREDGSNEIEWIGASTSTNGAPQGVAISPGAGWQTLTFDPASDPITGFTGDGAITATTGTLEHLAVAVNSGSMDRSTGAYTMYVDNVVSVGAGAGGSDLVISDFEGFALGDEVLFQEPTFSGSTASHLSFPPSASEITDAQANGGTQSELLSWFFKDTTSQRWARITTAAALNLPAPAIDLTKPIRMDVLLLPSGLPPCAAADVNCDGAVDAGDLLVVRGGANWQQTTGSAAEPRADVNLDGAVDAGDLLVIRGGAVWQTSTGPCVCP